MKVNVDGKEYCVETLIFENKRLKMILNEITQEIEQIGAVGQETNGETDYLKGITTCLDIIDKYSEEK